MKTADKILDTALEMFNERGYVNVGVREIARELGISPGNLSYHFKRKEDVLLSLLQSLSSRNDALYDDYASARPSIERFLELMRSMFNNQYNYRGIVFGNLVARQELHRLKVFNYEEVVEKRRANFQTIFMGLRNAGQLEMTDEEVQFMVSFITLFGRFWLAEGMYDTPSASGDSLIQKYMELLTTQLGLFATDLGRESIRRYRRRQS